MWVDITSLIKDTGVGEYIDITLLPKVTDTGDYGVIDYSDDENDENVEKIEEVFCTMVEVMDNVVDTYQGSYVPRVTYDFYVPAAICLENDLTGAKITTSDGRKFMIGQKPLVHRYVSHCVVTATEDRLTYND